MFMCFHETACILADESMFTKIARLLMKVYDNGNRDIFLSIFVYIYAHTHTHTYIQVHTHTHTHTYTSTRERLYYSMLCRTLQKNVNIFIFEKKFMALL